LTVSTKKTITPANQTTGDSFNTLIESTNNPKNGKPRRKLSAVQQDPVIQTTRPILSPPRSNHQNTKTTSRPFKKPTHQKACPKLFLGQTKIRNPNELSDPHGELHQKTRPTPTYDLPQSFCTSTPFEATRFSLQNNQKKTWRDDIMIIKTHTHKKSYGKTHQKTPPKNTWLCYLCSSTTPRTLECEEGRYMVKLSNWRGERKLEEDSGIWGECQLGQERTCLEDHLGNHVDSKCH
jgi:hypothetical protein